MKNIWRDRAWQSYIGVGNSDICMERDELGNHIKRDEQNSHMERDKTIMGGGEGLAVMIIAKHDNHLERDEHGNYIE